MSGTVQTDFASGSGNLRGICVFRDRLFDFTETPGSDFPPQRVHICQLCCLVVLQFANRFCTRWTSLHTGPNRPGTTNVLLSFAPVWRMCVVITLRAFLSE